MKSFIKMGILATFLLAALWWLQDPGEGPEEENVTFDTAGKAKTVLNRDSAPTPSPRAPRPFYSENRSGKDSSVIISPESLRRPSSGSTRKYDEDYMRDFLRERKEVRGVDPVTIGKGKYYISKNYKAVMLPESEGEGYYRVGAWVLVPVDYKEEDDGYPILFNKSDRRISVLTGLATVKLKDGFSLERGKEMIIEKGLEVDATTDHLNLIHAKFYPVTVQSLNEYEKKLEDMGIFARIEFEIDRGGPKAQ